MLYTVADANWSLGRPVPPLGARAGFHRMRSSAVTIAAGRPVLAAAIRYDSLRGRVVAHGAGHGGRGGPWAAPATMNDLGAVTVLAPVPADLVRVIGPAELRLHSGNFPVFPRSHVRAPCAPEAGRRPDAGTRNRTGESKALLPRGPEVSQGASAGPEVTEEAPDVQPPVPWRRDARVSGPVVSRRGAQVRRSGERVLAVLTRKSARRDQSHVKLTETTR